MNKRESRDNRPISRRRFIAAAVAGGTAVGAASNPTHAGAVPEAEVTSRQSGPGIEQLEEIVARCGSEFGDLRRIR